MRRCCHFPLSYVCDDNVIPTLYKRRKSSRILNDSDRIRIHHLIIFGQAVVKKLKRYEELYELKKEREKENEDPVERLQVS